MNQITTPSEISPKGSGICYEQKVSPFARWLGFLCLFLTAGVLMPSRSSALSITVGSGGTSTSNQPLMSCMGYSYSQQIYLASDLVAGGATGGAGFLSTISFNMTSYPGSWSASKDWVVYLGNTSTSTFATSSSWLPVSGLTKVFDGVTSFSATGWYTITFSTPFYWDGTSNLVVAVDENTSSWNCTASFAATSRTGTRSMVAYSDPTNMDPAAPPSASATFAGTPDIKLDYLPATPCGSTVTGGTAIASATTLCPGTSVGLNNTGATAATGLTYVWDSSATGTGGWAPVSAVLTGPAFTFTPPSGRTLYYRMRITCTATGATATSTTVSVTSSSISTPPYTQDFESGPVNVNVPCAAVTGTWEPTSYYYGYYWDLKSGTSSYPSITNHTAAPGSSKYLWAGAYVGVYGLGTPSGNQQYWYTPGLQLYTGKTYRFSYWYVNSGYSGYACNFGMVYNTSQSATGATTIKAEFNDGNTVYKKNEGDFTVGAAGVYYLGVKINQPSFNYYGTAIDDIMVQELPDCNTATAGTFGPGGKATASPNVICSTPGTTTLSVGSTPPFSGLSFSWEVAAGTPTTFTAAGITAASGSYTITTGGAYYFRCKVICTATGLSSYSDTVKVTTTPIPPPYREDFEAGASGVNMPCASFTGSFTAGTTSGWDLRTGPFDATYAPGIKNHTPGGSKYLFGGYYMGSYASTAARYWFTPGLALTAAKAYDFSFWVSNNGYYPSSYPSSAIELGVRIGNAQTETAMTIAAGADTTITPNALSTATYHQVHRGFIAPTTGTYYVGIRFNALAAAYPGVAFDDIGLDQLPPCAARPAAGTARAIPALICGSGSTTVSLLGTSVASDLTFQWQESATGTPGSFTDIAGANTPGYTTATLTAARYYRCVVVCPLIAAPRADTSTMIKVNVTPIIPPYIEDFETGTAGVNMPCASAAGGSTVWSAGSLLYWDLREGPYSSYPSITNHTPGGKKYLYSGYYNGPYYGPAATGDNYFWFTPGLALTGGKSYKCSFWFSSNGYASSTPGFKAGIYAGTAQTAAGMTIRAGGLDTNLNVMSGGYRQIVRSFTAPVTGTYYVGIKTVHTGYNYPGVPIDDIGIDQNPACAGKPAAGTADASPALICSSGTSKMRLSGTSAVSDLTYQWLESTTGATGPWVAATGGSGATAADFTTPTLSAARWYRCVVTCTVSGLSDTSSVAVVNAGAIIPPYRETFESVMPGTNAACASNSSTWGTSSSTTYWTTKGFPYTGYGMIYNNHTPGGANYLWGGYYFGYSPSAGAMWFTPAIQLVKDSTYEFSYWYQGPAYYYYNSGVELGMYYGTAQTEAAMTNLVRPLFIDKRSEYKQLIGRFKAVGTGNYYMGIKVRHTYSTYSYYGTAIDDIGLDQLAPCTGKPTAGVIASKPDMLCSAGTVALDMDYTGVTKASGLSYRWEWTNTDPSGGAFIAAGSSTAASAPNLTSPSISATTWFRCVVKCTFSGDSAISAPIKVDVGIVTPPYIQTFEGVDQGVNAPCASNTYTFSPSSWQYWGTYRVPLSTSYPAIYNHTPGGTAYLLAGNGMKYYSGADEYWFTPRIQLTGGKMYQFSYWYSGSAYSGGKTNLSAAYGTTNTAAGMSIPIGTALVDVNESDYKQFAGTFTPGTSGAYYLGIKVAHTTYCYPGIAIDDIGLQEVPPCSSTVVAGKINSVPVHLCDAGGSATLNLTGSTLATGLTYQWMSSSLEAGPYTAAGTGLPYATAALTSTTWFKVIVTCTASGKADTSTAFRMGVGGFELPYAEDFESTPAGQKPLCSDATAWGMYYYDAWNVYAGTYTGMYTNHTPGGKKHLIGGYYLGYATYSPTYTTVTDDNYWFTPGFNMRGGYKYKLSFWYLGASSGYKNRMGVFYGGSQSAGAMTKTIIPFTLVSNTDYVQADTTFTVATSGVYYLGFKKSSGTLGAYNYYGVAFDDINLNYAPCDGTPTAGTITGSVASGTGLCKGTPVQLRSAGATVKLVPGIRYRWQRRGLPGAPVNWTNVPGAIDTMLSSDSLIGYEYRLAVICHNTHDTVYTPAYQLPQLPPHPPVVISPSSSPIMYCLGDTVHLNATYYAGAVYDWRLEGASVAGWKFSDMGATEPGTYTVKITSALSPCPGYSNAVKLVANDPGYKVDITLPSDSVLCSGSSVVLTAVASKPGVTFQWRRNNIDIPGETGTTYMVTTGGFYRVAVFDGASSCPAVSRNIHFIVKPNPPAVITIPGGTLTACEEVGVQLDANLGGFSYQWSRSGSPVFGWVDSSVKATTSGVYSVKVRSADGCASVSADVNVTILPSPVPTIGRMGVYPSITLTATPTSYVSYTWMRTGTGGTGIEGTGNPLAVTKKGTYKVIVEDVNGCKGESAPLEILDEGLSVGNVSLIDIRVFPNPTQAKVYIESPVAVKVTVKDAAGKTVIDQTVVKEIDLGKYADGIYLFELRDVKTEQLVKQQRVNKVTK